MAYHVPVGAGGVAGGSVGAVETVDDVAGTCAAAGGNGRYPQGRREVGVMTIITVGTVLCVSGELCELCGCRIGIVVYRINVINCALESGWSFSIIAI